ncbi:MAG: chemotaxis protein CheW, partial [Rhodobacteraceae bacterium]|nr:chemotaxis protein CheW [Paracoccaceae bacterium]
LNADAQRILVLEVLIEGEPATVAINADIVHEVATIPVSAIDKLPATSGWPPEFVRGLFRHTDETFVLLPNLSAIFTAMAQRAAVA